ncbi:MAG: hypothetical protein WCK67_00170 [bacterium]
MMKINKLFSFLAGKREIAGVFISPRSTIELVLIDIDTNKVIKHKSVDFSYDVVQRQITSMQLLETTMIGLLDELNIPQNMPIVLSLPTILIGHLTAPIDLNYEEVKEALVSEAETNYIFKKYDPAVSWDKVTVNEDTQTQYLLYSAFRKEEIAQIEATFKKVKSNIVAIDSSYLTALRGLAATGLINNDIEQGNLYSVLIIAQNSFVLVSLAGNKIIEINETPLALKSFNAQDIYPTLTSYCIEGIQGQAPDHLIIVSESDEVSAEILSSYVDVDCKKTFVETNKYAQNTLFYGNLDFMGDKPAIISLEAVGAALYGKSLIPTSLNFMAKAKAGQSISNIDISLFGKTISISPKKINQILIILIVLVAALYLSILLIGSSIDKSMSVNIDELNQKLTSYTAQKEQIEKENESFKKGDVTAQVLSVYENNGKLVQSYNAISSVIPSDLWVNTVEIDNNMSSSIKGRSSNVELIMQYYQDLLAGGKFNSFKVQSIKIAQPKTEESSTLTQTQNNAYPYNNTPYGAMNGQQPKVETVKSESEIDLAEKSKLYDFTLGDRAVSTSTEKPGQ